VKYLTRELKRSCINQKLTEQVTRAREGRSRPPFSFVIHTHGMSSVLLGARLALFRGSRSSGAVSRATASTGTMGATRRVTIAAAAGNKTIILYTKETCPLCDGLKDKVQAILDRAPFTGSALQGYSIESRDILSNPDWEREYSMEIPVMAVARPDGSEVRIPRTPPRITADKLEQTIIKYVLD